MTILDDDMIWRINLEDNLSIIEVDRFRISCDSVPCMYRLPFY